MCSECLLSWRLSQNCKHFRLLCPSNTLSYYVGTKLSLSSFCHLRNCEHLTILASLLPLGKESLAQSSLNYYFSGLLALISRRLAYNECLYFDVFLQTAFSLAIHLLSIFFLPVCLSHGGTSRPHLYPLCFLKCSMALGKEEMLSAATESEPSPFVVLPEQLGSHFLFSLLGYWTWWRHVIL